MELDRNQLKIQAYKEKLSSLEDTNADFRVEITVLSNEVQKLQAELSKANEDLALLRAQTAQVEISEPEIVEPEVVQTQED